MTTSPDEELHAFQDWLIRRDEHALAHTGGRSVSLEECDVCGRVRELSRSTEPSSNPTVSRMSMSIGSCERCLEIRSRAPEVFDWILGVVATIRCKALRERLLDSETSP